jgi:hypothetical protein
MANKYYCVRIQTTGTTAQGCQYDVHAYRCITKEIKVDVGNVNFLESGPRFLDFHFLILHCLYTINT